jgi:hypothetical protein
MHRPIGRQHSSMVSSAYPLPGTEAGPIRSRHPIMNMYRPIGRHHSSKVSSAYPLPGTEIGPIRIRHYYNAYAPSNRKATLLQECPRHILCQVYRLDQSEAAIAIMKMHRPIGRHHSSKVSSVYLPPDTQAGPIRSRHYKSTINRPIGRQP